MEFFEDGEEIISTWQPGGQHQGFHDILHGGLQSVMMDEIGIWAIFVKLDTAGVTYRLTTRFRLPVMISKGPVTLRARLTEQKRSIATVRMVLFDGEGNRCSEGTAEYFVLSREKADKDFHFPGKEAFYPQQ